MGKNLVVSAAIAIVALGSLAPICAQAATKPGHVALHLRHHGSMTRHAVAPSCDITSFSSSSAPIVGVNHPPKK